MISDMYKCIFVHIPKTAGQSVTGIFLGLHGLTWETRAPLLLRRNPDPANGPERLAHLTAREYLEFGYVSRETYDNYYKFAFTRNPWARLVSEYRFRGLEGRLDFRQFVEAGFGQQDSYSDLARHMLPQTDFLVDEQGEYIVDFIGRFENLAEDFRQVAHHLNLGDVRLPHHNQSHAAQPGHQAIGQGSAPAARDYHEYYDDRLRALVAEFYSNDISRFGYSFDGKFKSGPIVQERTR